MALQRINLLCLWLMAATNAACAQDTAAVEPATVIIDYAAQTHPLSTFWACFGYDEANYTYMRDGKKLLSELAALSPVPVYVRCHNLLTTGDGTPAFKWGSTNAYTEDARGRPVYDWHIVDSIFDTYVARGMKPLAEIGFMPEALSTHPEPYRHHWRPGVRYDSIYTGWAWPPVDYGKWGALVTAWVRHCVERYGSREVSSWLWEVWNEPNISYWKGTEQEYLRLYDTTAFAVKRALASARVGGPATTGPGWSKAADWLRDFLAHCAAGRIPVDFISYHAKGSPRVVDGHVRMNMDPQLKDVSQGFAIVRASVFRDLPVYITECDPEGCAACGMATNPENAYRNGTMYSSYTAASFSRIAALADSFGVHLAGAVSWSFEFEGQPWFDGFRDLATNGVDKPVLNVFRMYGLMRGNYIPVMDGSGPGMPRRTSGDGGSGTPPRRPGDGGSGTPPRPSAGGGYAYASADRHAVYIMLWNYSGDDVPGPAVSTQVVLRHLPVSVGKVSVTEYRIDGDHSNAYETWKRMGSPQHPTVTQYQLLEASGQLQTMDAARRLAVRDGGLTMRVRLPRQAVALLRVEL